MWMDFFMWSQGVKIKRIKIKNVNNIKHCFGL